MREDVLDFGQAEGLAQKCSCPGFFRLEEGLSIAMAGDDHSAGAVFFLSFAGDLQAIAATGEVNVGDDEVGLFGGDKVQRFGFVGDDADHFMAQALEDAFKVKTDDEFVLDDQNPPSRFATAHFQPTNLCLSWPQETKERIKYVMVPPQPLVISGKRIAICSVA